MQAAGSSAARLRFAATLQAGSWISLRRGELGCLPASCTLHTAGTAAATLHTARPLVQQIHSIYGEDPCRGSHLTPSGAEETLTLIHRDQPPPGPAPRPSVVRGARGARGGRGRYLKDMFVSRPRARPRAICRCHLPELPDSGKLVMNGNLTCAKCRARTAHLPRPARPDTFLSAPPRPAPPGGVPALVCPVCATAVATLRHNGAIKLWRPPSQESWPSGRRPPAAAAAVAAATTTT